ncbi:MAG: phage integrase N-terminal SAM-like domain-containing protein [Thaumarchaeota archaeon]|nr:phage integrase N-terminal SAM-like domain-containing protein [Nitrososphaerota archaeon]
MPYDARTLTYLVTVSGNAITESSNVDDVLEGFRRYLEVDLGLAPSTIKEHHLWRINRFIKIINKPLLKINNEDLRAFLSGYKDRPASKSNYIKSFRVFFRDYLRSPHLVSSFKLVRPAPKMIIVPSKQELKRFYEHVDTVHFKALFLFLSSSGLRLGEALSITSDQLDPSRNMVRLSNDIHRGETKRNSSIAFFNREARVEITNVLGVYKTLFGYSIRGAQRAFSRVSKKSGVKINAQMLREWFCNEMSDLGVADRWIDFFCGRVPRSILASHYSDYSPERLKKIYDQANLKVLEELDVKSLIIT